MRRHLLSFAIVTATLVLALPAAQAAPSGKRGTEISAQTRMAPAPRSRTRITVQRRSYLDLGSEAMPGERRYQDYAFPPTYSPASVIENTSAYRGRTPLPGPFDLPSKNNPWPWN